MRPIKFRAWVKRLEVETVGIKEPPEVIRNKMFKVTGLHFFEGGELTSISLDTENYGRGEEQDIWLSRHDVAIELMQFTGLKDKDGTEIYEGDIIKGTYAENSSKESSLAPVYYDAKRGVWCLREVITIGELSERGEAKIPILHPLMLFKGLTVVGNVYEHPELLKMDGWG